MSLKKLFLSIFLLVSLFQFSLSAQKNYPFTIKAGVGMTEDEPAIYPSGYKERFDKVPLLLLEFGYEVFRNFDVSIYGGYASYMRVTYLIEDVEEGYSRVGRRGTYAVFYGLRGKYNVLPLIMNSARPLRFELYPTASLGAVTSIWPEGRSGSDSKPYFECSIGAGGGFRITKGFGVYFEYGIGRYFSRTLHRIQGGLTFHF